MIELKVNAGAVKIQEKNLERMMTDNPETRQAIQALIRETMWEARNATAHGVERIIGNRGQTARSIRNIVFQKILGGNINIRDMKRGTAKWVVTQKTRKVDQNPHMRGGNRRKRSGRTIQIQGYEGKARGFILRWVDMGTHQRFIGGRANYKTNIEYLDKIDKGRGNRGRIIRGDFFNRIATQELGNASEKLSKMIEEEIAKITNQNNT